MYVLTHSCLAIGISVNLSIVLNDGQGCGNHLILTIIRAGTTGRLLTTAVITIKHPKRVPPLSFGTWGALSLKCVE